MAEVMNSTDKDSTKKKCMSGIAVAALLLIGVTFVAVSANNSNAHDSINSSWLTIGSRNLRQQSQQHRRTTLRTVTPEMAVLANVGDQQVLHDLFLDLDFIPQNSSLTTLSRLQETTNPNGNMIVKAEGLGPLFPMLRRDALGLGLMMASRFMRPVWQGKWLEFPSPDPYLSQAQLSGEDTADVQGKFINQYVGLQGWTGHLYTTTLKQATAKEREYEGQSLQSLQATASITTIPSLVPRQPDMTLDDKPSLIMDYRRGQNWNTGFVDECRPLDGDKLVDAGLLNSDGSSNSNRRGSSRTATRNSQWSYVWLCRGTAPRFLTLGGARVFVMFFMVQIMPETLAYNVTT